MLKKITLWVLTIHSLFIFTLLFSPKHNICPHKKHIAVHTKQIRPVEQKHPPSSRRQKTIQAPQAQSKTGKTSIKKTEKKEASTTQLSKKTKPVVVEKEEKKALMSKEVVEELEETITKIDEKRKKVYRSSKLKVPQLREAEPVFLEEPSYQEALVAYLHESLHLPEYGEVKIQLTLHEDGTVAKLTVLKAESLKNKAYLEKNLPLLKFPRLDKEEVFIFTFCNEI